MVKISIIIPIYNTGKYLRECLDSILCQSFSDFEIICINDGSTDSSNEILNEYAENYDFIKVINQENKGTSASRNMGLDNSNGKYIMFLDSDDYLERDALKESFEIAELKNLDLLIFKVINFDDKTRKKSKYSYFEMDLLKSHVKDRIFSYEDVKELLFRISVTAQGKLYKKELINNIRFKEGLIFEDNPFFMEMFLKSKRAYFYDKYLCFRRIRQDSILNSNFENFRDVVAVYNIIRDIIVDNGIYNEVKHKLFNRQCRDIFLRFSQVPQEYKEDFFNKIKTDFLTKKETYENENIFEMANNRGLEIFFKAIESDSPDEFELSIEIFDLNRKLLKLKKQNKKLKQKIANCSNPQGL